MTGYVTKNNQWEVSNDDGTIATLVLGDCLKEMKKIPDKSVDMILCDLPYGTTKNKWDTVIPFDDLWKEYKRIIKPYRAIVLFSQCPFDKKLAMSNPEWLKYEWIWEKSVATGFLNSKYAPLKCHETILVFSDGRCSPGSRGKNIMMYVPQMGTGNPYTYTRKRTSQSASYQKFNDGNTRINEGTRYPRDILRFSGESKSKHPTQKPVELLEYLIKTYTNEGELVLDNCMGSGSTGVACVNTNRRFYGIEILKEYFDIAKERIENAI